MSLDEATLEQVAQDGEMEYEKWPAMLEPLLERLNHIVFNDFVMPKPYPIINPILPSQNQSANPDQVTDPPTTLVSQTPTTPRTLPPVPPFPGSSASNVPDSQPAQSSQGSVNETVNELPSELLQLLNSTVHTLRTAFSERPPHTIQRLAELVLRPNKHYKTLPAWLRAVDRVISVSSAADMFPIHDMPPMINGVNGDGGGGILWSTSNNNGHEGRNGYDKDSLGSDESLGGALLTPIPWLKDVNSASSSSGTNGSTGSIGSTGPETDSSSKIEGWQEGVVVEEDMLGNPIDSTAANAAADAAAIASVADEQDTVFVPGREDGAVTQGELMRMEQEAGVIPTSSASVGQRGNGISVGIVSGHDGEGIDMDEEGEAMPPHARGPDVVGTVDMGLVEGQEREVRISSPPEERLRDVNTKDAQGVLEGSDKPIEQKAAGSDSGGSSDSYVDVGKDEMQVDTGTLGTAAAAPENGEPEGDGDIVLVDADGADDEETADKEKADVSGENIGADASDTTAQ